ncbi:MAG: right-handed parallel beta-helix repeat-containing protein [Spirochaetes bacterium]|nr:right-handed parallel beta-helix repeat-containing protein [Spirochaetota bacterium]
MARSIPSPKIYPGFSLLLGGMIFLAAFGFGQPATEAMVANVLAKRPKPLTNLAIANVLRIADFGAKADDGLDDRPAVMAALEAARTKTGPVAVVFGKGRFHLGGTNQPMILLEGYRDLLLDGDGAEVIVTHPVSGFIRVQGCTNVIVRRFTLDWDPIPFAQGTVRSVDPAAGTFEVEIEAGFPLLDAPPFTLNKNGFGMLKHPTIPGRMKEKVADFFIAQYSPVGGRRFSGKLKRPEEAKNFQAGDRLVQVVRAGGVAFTSASLQTTYQELTAYSAPGGSYTASASSLVNLLRCRTLIKAGRWQSANADAVHMQAQRLGPWVEGCVFEGQADDAMNVYTLPSYAAPGGDARRLIMNPWAASPLRSEVGDQLRFFNPREGLLLGEATVVAIDRATRIFTFDRDLPAMGLGDQKTHDHAFNVSVNSGAFVVRGNVFRNSRRFGIYVKAGPGLIEDNVFEGLSASALCVRNEPGWPEGFLADGVVFRRNAVRDCGFAGGFLWAGPTWAVLSIGAEKTKGPSPRRLQKSIAIESNQIDGWQKLAIYVGQADGVRIDGNRFGACAPSLRPELTNTVLWLENTRGVRHTGNRYATNAAGWCEVFLDGTENENFAANGNR